MLLSMKSSVFEYYVTSKIGKSRCEDLCIYPKPKTVNTAHSSMASPQRKDSENIHNGHSPTKSKI